MSTASTTATTAISNATATATGAAAAAAAATRFSNHEELVVGQRYSFRHPDPNILNRSIKITKTSGGVESVVEYGIGSFTELGITGSNYQTGAERHYTASFTDSGTGDTYQVRTDYSGGYGTGRPIRDRNCPKTRIFMALP